MTEVEVIGIRETVKLKALIGAGFTGYLCVPYKVAEKLGLVLVGDEEYELANGQWITQFYFAGKVRFLGVTQDVQILVSKSETAQIGTLLLADCHMTIDFASNKVRLTRAKIQ